MWVHPLLCRHVQRAVIVSPSKAFQEEVTQLTGVPRHHQRLRFGFPASKVLGAIGQLSDSLQVRGQRGGVKLGAGGGGC